jgi:hypothetical protein
MQRAPYIRFEHSSKNIRKFRKSPGITHFDFYLFTY